MLDPEFEVKPIQTDIPRATLLSLQAHLPEFTAQIWVGGAWADFGQPVELDHVRSARVIDLAGVLPDTYREAARRWTRFVFDDIDAVPASLERLLTIAAESAATLRSEDEASPAQLYVFCQYGMNRSTLLTGLVLRHLGLPGPETVHLLQKHRPGALANDAFRRIVEEFEVAAER